VLRKTLVATAVFSSLYALIPFATGSTLAFVARFERYEYELVQKYVPVL